MSFHGARFANRFSMSAFSLRGGAQLWFTKVIFAGERISFDGADFQGSKVSFDGAVFAEPRDAVRGEHRPGDIRLERVQTGTSEYKITPLEKAARELLGYPHPRRVPPAGRQS